MFKRYIKKPQNSFFLFGPRGTGKSTWLKEVFEDSHLVDLLDIEEYRRYSARPELLKQLLLAVPDNSTIVIDEIQRVPELLTVVHSVIEEHRGIQCIMTGSSSRKLKRQGVDLLGGRALLYTMHPFMAIEMGSEFSFEKAMTYGMVPVIAASVTPSDILRSYIALYVREEVHTEGLVRNIGNFSRFLEVVSLSQGTMLNTTAVARDCEVSRDSVEGYLSIIEDLLLSFRLPSFTKRAKRAVVAHPKFYFFDVGVYRSLRPIGPLDPASDISGAALETLVVQHLRAWIAYRGARDSLYYWRTKFGVEVDFILYGESGFFALEVKSGTRVRPDELRGLLSFSEDYPQCTPMFLYGGKDRLVVQGIPCVPVEEFLRNLDPQNVNAFIMT